MINFKSRLRVFRPTVGLPIGGKIKRVIILHLENKPLDAFGERRGGLAGTGYADVAPLNRLMEYRLRTHEYRPLIMGGNV